MTNSTQPIKLLADFSLLGYLALATNCTKTKFFSFIKQDNAEELYEKLLDLDTFVNSGYIELIVPYTVIQELKQRKVNPYTTEARAIEMEQKKVLKNQINIYTHTHAHTKYVFSPGDSIPVYSHKAEEIGKLYSEMPKDPFNIALSYNSREKPFLYYNENVSYYALKMAEATMLGMDLLTLHHHFFSQYPVDVAEAIEEINQDTFKSDVKPISLDEVLEIMFDETKRKDYALGQQNKPKFIDVEFLGFQEFKNATQQEIKVKKENFKIITRRTLFLKYLDKPLEIEECHKYEPKKFQTKKTFTSKIKFDLCSPNAKEIIENFLMEK